MPSSFSRIVLEASADLLRLPNDELVTGVNKHLASYFPSLSVSAGTISDVSGSRVVIESLISTTPTQGGEVSADTTAVAAVVQPELDAASLRAACDRIAAVKSLKKSKPTVYRQTATLGLVIAARSAMPLDDIAEQMRSLNRGIADTHRADMVAVLSRGTANYGLQLFTDTRVGMVSPPDANASYIPPVLVLLTATSTKSHAFNNLVSLVIGHLAFFSPGVALPNMKDVLEGVPIHSSVVCTYQYNLLHTLVEVTDMPRPVHPYVIEDSMRSRLLKLVYQPWQDGGVIVGEGKLPLSGILALAGRKLPLDTFPTPQGRQLSGVLRIDAPGFVNVMANVSGRSRGITIRPETQKFTMTKWVDEGTSSPFGSRILMTPLTMRDMVLTDKKDVSRFDEIYQFIMNHLIDLRLAGRELERLWEEHCQKVQRGEAVTVTNIVQVIEPIDQPFFKYLRDMVVDAARVAKKMQNLTRIFGIEIGFMFQKQTHFDRGIVELKNTDPQLATYLLESRKWLKPLRLMRDDFEHGTFLPPRLRYEREDTGHVRVDQPTLNGLVVTESVKLLLSRLNRFVEEVLMWCFQRSLDARLGLVEIPIANRNPEKVERFTVRMRKDDEQAWEIVYSDDQFDDI